MPNYAEETLALLAYSYFDQSNVSLWNYRLLLKPLMVKSPVEAQHFQEDLRNYLQLKNSLREKEEDLARNHKEFATYGIPETQSSADIPHMSVNWLRLPIRPL